MEPIPRENTPPWPDRCMACVAPGCIATLSYTRMKERRASPRKITADRSLDDASGSEPDTYSLDNSCVVCSALACSKDIGVLPSALY